MDMNIYTNYMKKAESYLLMEDVKEDEETISAYTLCNKVKEKFNELRELNIENSLIADIEKDNNSIKGKLNKIFKKNDYINIDDASYFISADYEKAKILIVQREKNSILITKKRDEEDIQLAIGVDRNFITKYYDKIMETLTTLEEFVDLVGGPIGTNPDIEYITNYEQIIYSDSLIRIEIDYDVWGGTKIYFESKYFLDEHYYCRPYRKPSVCEYLCEHEEEILKKIPIKISELNPTLKYIAETKSKTKPKVKTLTRK